MRAGPPSPAGRRWREAPDEGCSAGASLSLTAEASLCEALRRAAQQIALRHERRRGQGARLPAPLGPLPETTRRGPRCCSGVRSAAPPLSPCASLKCELASETVSPMAARISDGFMTHAPSRLGSWASLKFGDRDDKYFPGRYRERHQKTLTSTFANVLPSGRHAIIRERRSEGRTTNFGCGGDSDLVGEPWYHAYWMVVIFPGVMMNSLRV
jgi:hypothetical protein